MSVPGRQTVPHGVICLLSGLRFHKLGTQSTFEVWLALDRRAALLPRWTGAATRTP